jgi:ATP-dependent Clp protease ATP-binding subunit ClpC
VHLQVSEALAQLSQRAVAGSMHRGQYFIGVEHLFAAILDEPGRLPAQISDAYLPQLYTALREVSRTGWREPVPSVTGEVFHTPRAIAVLHEAQRLAERIGRGPATESHLLLAILSDERSSPSRAMERLRLPRRECMEALREALQVTRDPRRPGPGGIVPGDVKEPHLGTAAAAGNGPEALAAPANGLEGLTRDLSLAARMGDLAPAIGRKQEIMQILQILTRKTKNNAMLVGEAGVGKTQVVEGLALKLEEARAKGESGLPPFRIVELNLAALMAGTQYRGAFEEKLLGLLEKLKREPHTVLFIDEAHLIMGSGTTEGDGMDLANLLKPALARGEIRCIGATTLEEYRKFVEKDPAIERRFQMVRIEELSEEATRKVLDRLRPGLEKHHGVAISARALEAAIALSQRYLPNRRLPDKAIDVLDQACARHRLRTMVLDSDPSFVSPSLAGSLSEAGKITPHSIRKVISQMAGVPLEELTAQERANLQGLEKKIKERLIGQDEAVARAVAAVKKSRAGLGDPNRPESVMLFLGPSGVGKTELAKLLARNIFGSGDHLIRFDMSQYSEAHAVSRLLGAPPGYAGHDEEGLLSGAVRRMPFAVLLFDEIEKAHPAIYDVFLPLFDEGRLQDARGRVVSFRHCLVVLTSNIAAELLSRTSEGDMHRAVIGELRRHFRPELINRIDEIVPFYPLLAEDLRSILRLEINALRVRLREKRIGIRMYQQAYEHLAKQGYSPQFGARELRRVVSQQVAAPISELLLSEDFAPKDMIDVLMEDGRLVVRKGARQQSTRGAAP